MKYFFLQSIQALLSGTKHTPALASWEEEAVQSPMRVVLSNFFRMKAAVLGLAVFVAMFVLVFGLSVVFPLDIADQDATQQNVAPGYAMSKIPVAMRQNPRAISVGPIFSVGADQAGNLHVWGQLTERQKKLPASAKEIVQVSAGLDHLLALDANGHVYTWGHNRFGLDKIPPAVKAAEPIQQVVAGYQFSLAVSKSGELFFWGNGNLIELDADTIPEEIQHHVVSVDANSSNVVALLDDGTLRVLGRKAAPVVFFPETEKAFIQVAVSDQAAIGLTTDGEVLAWGNDFYGLLTPPPEIQGKTKSVSAGRFHFVALLEDGSLVAWGRNQFGQTDLPQSLQNSRTATEKIVSGYFLNYAVDRTGAVHPFGLKGYLMGTDDSGRDVFRRLIAGGRLTLTVGAVSVLLAVVIGVCIGGLAGFYGGKIDLLLMRLAEIVGSIPFLPLAMTLSVLIGNRISETNRIFAIMAILGILSWPGMAQLVRGQILAEREKEFVLAARATGIRELSILFRYIIPNIITPIIIWATLRYASSMLTESALSFLGFGVVEPNPTWGNMLTGSQSSQVIASNWWRWVFPSIAICLTTISINFVGDGLRDAIDPHSSER